MWGFMQQVLRLLFCMSICFQLKAAQQALPSADAKVQVDQASAVRHKKETYIDTWRSKQNYSSWYCKRQDIFIGALISACGIDKSFCEQFKQSLPGKQSKLLCKLAKHATTGNVKHIEQALNQVSNEFTAFGKSMTHHISYSRIGTCLIAEDTRKKLIADIASDYAIKVKEYDAIVNDLFGTDIQPDTLEELSMEEIEALPQIDNVIKLQVRNFYNSCANIEKYPLSSWILTWKMAALRDQYCQTIADSIISIINNLNNNQKLSTLTRPEMRPLLILRSRYMMQDILDTHDIYRNNKTLIAVFKQSREDRQQFLRNRAIGLFATATAIGTAFAVYKWKHLDPRTKQQLFAKLHFAQAQVKAHALKIKAEALKRWKKLQAIVYKWMGKKQQPVVKKAVTGWLW